ncbi:hypothetical protein ACHAWT_010491 [Skeletonema menzelii]
MAASDRTSTKGGSNSPPDDPNNSSPAPSEISTIALSLVGTFVAARCLAVVSRLATALAAPICGFYLMSTCPTNETFDSKKELKRVLRGFYKSDADPSKPKNFFEKALAKVNATVEAEAAALAGCNVEIIDLLGLVKIASINNSITQTSYYFLGAVNKWRYIMAKDFPGKETKKD